MAYTTILVYLSNEDQAPRLMNVAKMLARQNRAHLIGLHVIPGVEIYPGISYPVDPRVFTDLSNADTRELVCGSAGRAFLVLERLGGDLLIETHHTRRQVLVFRMFVQ